MSQTADIKKMTFKQLQNEVQALRDELAMTKRHYQDLLYNLDDDNIAYISASKVRGSLKVEGAVIADSLYSDLGEIADLTVDRISTSKKIQKYLSNDVTDDNYFEGYDNGIYWIQAIVENDGNGNYLTEKLTNRYGEPVYWLKKIDKIVDGVPYDQDGIRVGTTTTVTDYPCTVYKYKKNVKAQFTYIIDADTGYANPQIVMGIGTDVTGTTDHGKGFIYKDSKGFTFEYVNSAGSSSLIRIDDKGGHLIGDWDLSNDSDIDTLVLNDDSFAFGIGDDINTFVWGTDMKTLTNTTTGAVISITDNMTYEEIAGDVPSIPEEEIEKLFNSIYYPESGEGA